MAKQLKLAAEVRTSAGRSAVKKIKQQGLVPAVIYGAKQQPENLQVKAREIQNLLSHATGEHLLVELEIAGSNRLALIQEVQHDPIRGDVLHVDFHAVSADERIHAEVPVEPVGEAVGVKNFGGILESAMHSVEVECLPKDLPEVIRVDVSALNLNEAINLGGLPLPAGVALRGDQDLTLTVVRVAPPTVSETEQPSAAAGAEAGEAKK